ncbi:MAG: thiamine pyrophosphate-binding protein, partial [Calditrichia bacterium]
MHGGELIAEVLRAHHVESLFTLCGGHISPILVACKKTGIRVVDTRHEATAVFAADAMARLSGIPGVAAVTAGPGVTNTVTAVKNARVAQSAVVLIGGATATVLKGRGALQDIDQISLLKSAVKWHASVKRLKQLQPILVEAFKRAQQGVPGPVFVEIPVDLLYHEPVVRNWYGNKSPGDSIAGKLQKLYLNYHVNRIFAGAGPAAVTEQSLNIPTPATPPGGRLKKVATKLKEAKNPLLLLGSQVVFHPGRAKEIAGAVRRLNIPVYLSGMSRGLLGKSHPLQMRHKRREALRKSDFIILAGVPCDFRLDYGRHIPRGAYIVSVNLNRSELFKNRRPNLAVRGHPGAFLMQLGKLFNNAGNWNEWRLCLRQWDEDREQEISEQAQSVTNGINPLYLCSEIEIFIADD